MAQPFKFLETINQSKINLVKSGEFEENDYEPFIINKGLSYFTDTIFHANEMNRYYNLPKGIQYDYFLLAINKKKRFSKWAKLEKDENFLAVQEYYNFSIRKTLEAMKILTKEQIEDIKMKNNKGGILK